MTNLLQPFSRKSHTPTVAKEFQIGLNDPTEADLEHFWNCCSEGFLGERLYHTWVTALPLRILSDRRSEQKLDVVHLLRALVEYFDDIK